MRLTSTVCTRVTTLVLFVCLMPLLSLRAYAEVEGGNPFHCPEEHVYVYCGELHDNLDYYGYPKATYGYGSITVQGPWVSEHLDKCGKGKIKRRWKVKHHYDTYWCEQTIHITDPHGSGFDGHKDVYWPKDYHMKECGGSMHPDHLPKHYNWPEFNHHGCSKLGLRYSDKIHPYHGHKSSYGHQSYGHKPCKVVYRTWELIDWCQYESGYGGHGYTQGRWTYEQKIFIYDDEAPTITFCSDDIVADGGDCKGGKTHVSIPKVKATDNCGEVYFSYSRKKIDESAEYHSYTSTGVFYSGADASGYFEPGKTLVTFKAFDICGNTTECQLMVEVEAVDNKPPSVIGISSLTAVLVQSDTNEGELEIWADEFNTSSSDNCTDVENLKFSLEPNVFTCEDFGTNQVKFIVTDEAGNSDYIMVEVVVQANSFECLGGEIKGNVMSDAGAAVEEVQVTVMDGMAQMTNKQGAFAFDDIPLGRKLEVTPYKNTDPMRGVDMYDYALLSLHVDGVKLLKDPYQLLAADINGDDQVDFSDLLAMQRLLAGLDKSMETNTSWIIFDRDFVFPDTIDPLAVALPTSYTLEPYNGGDTDIQFMAIKVGDIGQIHQESASADASPGEQLIVTNDQIVEQGQYLNIPFQFTETASANTMSFTLDLDAALFEVVEVKSGRLGTTGTLDIIYPSDDKSTLVGTWFSWQEETFSANESLFELSVVAKQKAILSNALNISSTYAEAKTTGRKAGVNRLKLNFKKEGLDSELVLFQNAPNPFRTETAIGFFLPEPGDVTLRLQDVSGKIVHRMSQQFGEGYQEFLIDRQEVSRSGLLFYSIQMGEKQITKKMMVIE